MIVLHCLVTVEGTSYERACRILATHGMSATSHPDNGYPFFTSAPLGDEIAFEMIYCDTVVIGQGRSGKAAASRAGEQGHVADIPTKLLYVDGRVLVLVPTVVVHHLEDRLDPEGRSA